MRTLVAIPCVFISFFLVRQCHSAETFLCVTEERTGFEMNTSTKEWVRTNFSESPNKLILRTPGNQDSPEMRDTMRYIGSQVGEGETSIWCPKKDGSEQIVWCNLLGGRFTFHKEWGRYTYANFLGYSVGFEKDDPRYVPFIEIGRCSVIN